MAAGVPQVMAGVLVEDAAVIVTWVEPLRFCGVVVSDDGDGPAGAASTEPACTSTVPAALAVTVPLANVARAGLDKVHWVLEVTSCVVPSLRWAVAFNTDEPPTLAGEGVAVT